MITSQTVCGQGQKTSGSVLHNVLNSSRIHQSHKPLWCFKPSRDRTVTKMLCLLSVSWLLLFLLLFLLLAFHFLPHPLLSLSLSLSMKRGCWPIQLNMSVSVSLFLCVFLSVSVSLSLSLSLSLKICYNVVLPTTSYACYFERLIIISLLV